MKKFFLGFLIVLPKTIIDSLLFAFFTISGGMFLMLGFSMFNTCLSLFLAWQFGNQLSYMLGDPQFNTSEKTLYSLFKKQI